MSGFKDIDGGLTTPPPPPSSRCPRKPQNNREILGNSAIHLQGENAK